MCNERQPDPVDAIIELLPQLDRGQLTELQFLLQRIEEEKQMAGEPCHCRGCDFGRAIAAIGERDWPGKRPAFAGVPIVHVVAVCTIFKTKGQ